MQYTKYFSRMKKAYGLPHLTEDGFSTYFNVIVLEDRIKLLQSLNYKYDTRSHDILILSLKETLGKITKGLSPEQLLKSLVND